MRVIQFIVLAILLSSCYNDYEERFYEASAKAVNYSAAQDEKDRIIHYYKGIATNVVESGNKPMDVEVYTKAAKSYQSFQKAQRVLLDSDLLEKYLKEEFSKSLDSFYVQNDFKPGRLKQIKSEFESIFSSKPLNKDLQKSLLLLKLVSVEKEAIEELAMQLGAVCLKFDIIKPVIFWEKDTVALGDSIYGVLFIYSSKISFMMDKMMFGNSVVKKEKYYYPMYSYNFSFKTTAETFDEKGEALKNWKAKMYYKDLNTLKDTVVTIERNYIVERNSSGKR